MGDQIFIKQVQVLADLKGAFAGFGGETAPLLDQTEQILRRVQEELRQRLEAARRALDSAEEQVSYAREAVADCENQQDDDGDALDCSQEYDDLHRARRGREASQRRLQEVKLWQARVERQVEDYRRMAAGLKRLATQRTSQVVTFLQNKINEIRRYQSLTGGTEVSSGAGLSGDEVLSGVTGVAAAGVAGSAAAAGWQEKGICEVRVADLPQVNDINAAEFRKVPMEEMQAGLRRYQEMQGLLAAGHENTREHWAQMDREKGLSYPEGYQRIYESFYGMEPIRVTKDGNHYTIENGRHRIWLAKQMGIATLPASVVERKVG